MTFGHPYVLLALPVLPLVALLYIRRAGRREMAVPSLALWRAAAVGTAAETGTRLGAFDLPLVLALAFLASVILAAGGPVLTLGKRSAPHVLVIVDRSASMTAPGKFAQARSEALELLGRLDSGKVTIIGLPLAAGPVLHGLVPAQARLRLLSLSPTDLPLEIGGELSRCAGVARRASVVVVVTDNPRPVPERLAGKPVLVVSRGGRVRNVAIDAFEVTPGDGGAVHVFLAVKNYSDEAATVPVAVRVWRGAGPLTAATALAGKSRTLVLPPGGRAGLTESLPAGDSIGADLDVDDGLDVDDHAVAVRAGPGRVRVAYVGRGNQFILRSLELLPDVALSQFRLTGDVDAEFDLYIYDGVTPDKLPGGDVVLVDPAGRVGPFNVRGATAGEWRGAVKVKDAPVLRHVNVAALRFKRTLSIDGGPAAETLVRLAGADAAVLMRWQDDKTRVLVIGCGLVLSETNWPMQSSFPMFWADVLAEAAGRRSAAQGAWSSSVTGERIVVRRRPGAKLSAVGPDGEPVPLVPGRGARSCFFPTRAGIYKVSGGPSPQRFAVNMLHPAESESAGAQSAPSADLEKSFLAPGRGAGVPLWRHLAAAALVLALGYWAAAARRGR